MACFIFRQVIIPLPIGFLLLTERLIMASVEALENVPQKGQAREEAAIAETKREERISQENSEAEQNSNSVNEEVAETEEGSSDD